MRLIFHSRFSIQNEQGGRGYEIAMSRRAGGGAQAHAGQPGRGRAEQQRQVVQEVRQAPRRGAFLASPSQPAVAWSIARPIQPPCNAHSPGFQRLREGPRARSPAARRRPRAASGRGSAERPVRARVARHWRPEAFAFGNFPAACALVLRVWHLSHSECALRCVVDCGNTAIGTALDASGAHSRRVACRGERPPTGPRPPAQWRWEGNASRRGSAFSQRPKAGRTCRANG